LVFKVVDSSYESVRILETPFQFPTTLPHFVFQVNRKAYWSYIDYPTQTPSTKMAPEIPKEQWAQVIEKTGGPVDYKRIPVPTPGPDEVLVNIKYSGVCHTDLHAVNGDWPLVSSL
jgi:hypothetical protein